MDTIRHLKILKELAANASTATKNEIDAEIVKIQAYERELAVKPAPKKD